MSKFVSNPSAKIDTNIKPFLNSQQNNSGVNQSGVNNTSNQNNKQNWWINKWSYLNVINFIHLLIFIIKIYNFKINTIK